MQISRTISVRPGQDVLETIVGPADQGLVSTVLRPELIGGHTVPESLNDRVWYRFRLARKTVQSEWCRRLPHDQRESLDCFIAPDGRIYAARWEHTEPSQLPSVANVDSGASTTSDSTVPPPEGPLGGVVELIWTLPAEPTRLESIPLEPGMYDLQQSAVCVEDDSGPGTTRLFELLTPDQGFRTSRSDQDHLRVRWGQANVSSPLAIQSAVFQMLERVLASAPQFRAVTLPVSGNRLNRGRFPQGELADQPKLGSRFSIFRGDPDRTSAVLSGVEVLSFREVAIPRSGFVTTGYELHALLTPDEAAFFAANARRLDVTLDPPDAERTSLNLESVTEPETESNTDELKARNYFSLLDVNKDGEVSAAEMAKSQRVTAQFQESGVEASFPMALDEFVRNYLQSSNPQQPLE
jgi:hypothetical protein